jgi:hypothetical protein
MARGGVGEAHLHLEGEGRQRLAGGLGALAQLRQVADRLRGDGDLVGGREAVAQRAAGEIA